MTPGPALDVATTASGSSLDVTATGGVDDLAFPTPPDGGWSDGVDLVCTHIVVVRAILAQTRGFEGELGKVLQGSNLSQDWKELHQNTISLQLELGRMEQILKRIQMSYQASPHKMANLAAHFEIMKHLRNQSLYLNDSILCLRRLVIPALHRSIPISIRQFWATLLLWCMASTRAHPAWAVVIAVSLILLFVQAIRPAPVGEFSNPTWKTLRDSAGDNWMDFN
ncbi:hypothetical protein BDN72DRAFT_906520 [Pluteus cervinus]|uniref:Uncharacterized protein n=1 Tax=Pluteus cervinus TaxID=181527 RepID=A0ACD3A012_9AGAR|nr:hypothetical protein BDN72DRAFT_906520 [Pluteus cervinus]